jgi:hypothetical protein
MHCKETSNVKPCTHEKVGNLLRGTARVGAARCTNRHQHRVKAAQLGYKCVSTFSPSWRIVHIALNVVCLPHSTAPLLDRDAPRTKAPLKTPPVLHALNIYLNRMVGSVHVRTDSISMSACTVNGSVHCLPLCAHVRERTTRPCSIATHAQTGGNVLHAVWQVRLNFRSGSGCYATTV